MGTQLAAVVKTIYPLQFVATLQWDLQRPMTLICLSAMRAWVPLLSNQESLTNKTPWDQRKPVESVVFVCSRHLEYFCD